MAPCFNAVGAAASGVESATTGMCRMARSDLSRSSNRFVSVSDNFQSTRIAIGENSRTNAGAVRPRGVTTAFSPASCAASRRRCDNSSSSSTIKTVLSVGNNPKRSSGIEAFVNGETERSSSAEPFISTGEVFSFSAGIAASGRNNVNVLPSPSTLSSLISPPRRRASSRLIANPKPVPPYRRLVLPSACWNASKMVSCFSAGIPIPLSLTDNAKTFSAP